MDNQTNEEKKNPEVKEEHHEKHNHDKKFNKRDEIKELNDKIEVLSNEVLRSKAELINYRKRKDEEVSNMLKYASSDLIANLLTVNDNFERALNVNEEILAPDTKSFLSGFKMIYTSLNEILKNNGVEEINPVGEQFDSTKENCLFTESDPTKEDETVLEVLTKGYTYNGKILRCATVKVNKIENNNEKGDNINE